MNFKSSVGGLATGLSSFYKSHQTQWIGWPGIALEAIKGKEEDIEAKLKSEGCCPVFLTQSEIENYYYGFCNRTLWPLFHYFTQHAEYKKDLWASYIQVNKAFCSAVIEATEPGDIVWIHDYHLMLLPNLLREKQPDLTIGFFLHIPFPSFEVFRLLPWRKEILEGLLGADLIGFHTYDYVRHFLDSVRSLIGYEHAINQITTESRLVKADAFPMGIDYKKYASAVEDPKVQKEVDRIRDKTEGRKIILSIDRLDYTKGIPERIEAFDLFLEKHPEYEEKVIFILKVIASRTGVKQYKELKKQLDEIVGKINGKYRTFNWEPIWYIYRFLPFSTLIALYNVADVALITPLRDGMNLVAKEFLATKADGKGVLILSEMAGGAREMGEAIIVNPNNYEEIVEALKEALEMSDEEQMERNRTMQKRLERYDVERWANDFLDSLLQVKEMQQEQYARKLTPKIKDKLIDRYLKSKNRLMLIDYDGTLVPFAEKPEKATPDNELLSMLGELAKEPKNELVVISGRDRKTLEKWFGNLNLSLVAEHGAWIKEKDKGWNMIETLRSDWKEDVRPILESYVDRTPGSFIEEKQFSLVWHFRKADPELGSIRASELKEDLFSFTANLNLDIMEGNKTIEVKHAGINKGRAALNWLSKKKWDFILAAGDDRTDEDIFAVLPESAYSIKVGLRPSQAKFSLDSVDDIRSLLRELAR